MIKLLDGSMSAQLQKFGYDRNAIQNVPHWTFPANSDRDLMEKVYKSFLDLGVNAITTNTYHIGSTMDPNIPENLEKKGIYKKYFTDTCEILCGLADQLEEVHVWGSVGTLATLYHDLSEYNGKYMDLEYAEKTAHNYYKTILELFQTHTKIRRLIFETIPSAQEGDIALTVLKEFPEMKAVMSFTFKEEAHLRHGETLHIIAEKMKKCDQIVGFGINCTDPENVMNVLMELEKYKFQEVFVYPNMGDSKFLSEGSTESDVFNQQMVLDWINHGATAIGGCCGVTDDDMITLKNLLDQVNAPNK